MIGEDDMIAERARGALTSLSTAGAAIAGLGLGAVMSRSLMPVAGAILFIGIAAHLCGMVGLRRKLFRAGCKPPLWQRIAYWACWATIAAVLVYAVWVAVR